jgi:hypothetical protein
MLGYTSALVSCDFPTYKATAKKSELNKIQFLVVWILLLGYAKPQTSPATTGAARFRRRLPPKSCLGNPRNAVTPQPTKLLTDYPTLPSSFKLNNLSASTANSIGN